MKKITLLGLLCFIVLSCASQKKDSTIEVSKYINTITAEELKKHLYVVASDEMEGRETGSIGQK